MSGGHLHLEGLRHHFGSTPVLRDVDLDVPPGRVLVLLGASGSGKTTLLRVAAGLTRADAGRVRLDDRVLSDPAIRVPPEHRGIGVVFQGLELWPQMTVAEHLAFGLPGRPRGKAALSNAGVARIAERVGLQASLLGRRVTHLSGGEQQRVAIARTLAAEPRVILYDEPLGSLDPSRREGLRALIRDIATREGRASLYVTHDAEEALELGDEIAVLSSGHLLARATPDALYRTPPSLLAARALGPVSPLPVHAKGGTLRSALGVVVAASDAAEPAGARVALLRPEHVVITSDGTPARVESVRPAGERWRFRARVGDRVVLGESPTTLEIGSDITIAVRGTPAVVPVDSLTDAPAMAAIAGGTV